MKTLHKSLLLGLVTLAAGLTAASAQTIISAGNFTSTGDSQPLNGTTTGITTNLPGGSWVWGGGYSWAAPRVNATWLSGPQNAADLGEEITAVGTSIASSGGYTKPTSLTISADINFYDAGHANSIVGLGFWSTMPGRVDYSTNGFQNFTGLALGANGTLSIYSGDSFSSAVSLGGPLSINNTSFYNLSYNVDTTTGTVSGIVFNGSSVSGLSSTSFSNAATQFAGLSTYSASRGSFDNLVVSTAVPEPGTLALLAAAGIGLVLFRKRRND